MELDLTPIGQFEWLDSLIFFSQWKRISLCILRIAHKDIIFYFLKWLLVYNWNHILDYAFQIPKEFKVRTVWNHQLKVKRVWFYWLGNLEVWKNCLFALISLSSEIGFWFQWYTLIMWDGPWVQQQKQRWSTLQKN